MEEYYPKYPVERNGDIKESIQNAKKNMDILISLDKSSRNKKQILFRYIVICVPNGLAKYQVIKAFKNSVRIKFCYDVDIDNYMDQYFREEATVTMKWIIDQLELME